MKAQSQRFFRAILASRFLTVSALIHLLLIILFGGTVLVKRYEASTAAFQTPSLPNEVSVQLPKIDPQDALPPAPSTTSLPPSAPAPAPSTDEIMRNSSGLGDIVSPIIPPTAPHITVYPGSQGIQPSPGAPALPGPMSKRTGPGRDESLIQYHGTTASEQAVRRALQWLQAHQNADGTWGSAGYHDAFTGLALLCYLGHGETPATSHDYAVVVTNAINALVAEGNANQGRFGGSANFADNPAAYQQAICTYALSEAYAMTNDARLAPLIPEAVDYIVRGQRPDGGWGYRYDTAPDVSGVAHKSDTSVSGWQIQALKAASLTGLPGMRKHLHPVLDHAIKFLDTVYNPRDGSYGYRAAGDHDYTLTGVGAFSKLFWMGRPDHAVRTSLKNIQSRDLNYTGAACNLYAWYYDTQACFEAQEGPWDWWCGRFQAQLNNAQSPDGSWPPTGGSEVGGFNSPAGDGPVYRTTLCCLMLEVFYRYLPDSNATDSGGNIQGL